jgi:hypothetical protein
MSIKLLLAAAIASLIQADLLRGHLNNPLSSPLLESRISGNSNGSHRQLPKKKDINELKRINAERKKLNQETRRKKEKKELVLEKSAWKKLTKNEKKNLLEELKKEEKEGKLGKIIPDKKPKEDTYTESNSNSFLEQYSTLLNVNIDPNDADSIWKSLNKNEKKQILALQEGKVIIQNGEIVDNPDYTVEKLTKEEKKELMKQEKEEGKNNDSEDTTTLMPNSDEVGSKPKPNEPEDDKKEDDLKPNSDANTFVNTKPQIDSQPDPETASTTTSTTTTTTTATSTTQPPETTIMTTESPEDKEEDMTSNSNPVGNSNANDFVIPMPSITIGSSTTTTTTTTPMSEGSPTCPNCYVFASELPDPSTPYNSNTLKWTMSGVAWSTYKDDCLTSDSCVVSGLSSDVPARETTYSNLTLTTEKDFKGGVLTFYLKGKLVMPNEAFFVSVDDEVASSPVSHHVNGWNEIGVVIDRGVHVVTWTHVVNPLGLKALPPREVVGLVVDGLRYSPFQKQTEIDQDFEDGRGKGLTMTSDGDATWEVVNDSIVAKTPDIKKESGSSNVNLMLHSQFGGTLQYMMSTSTTAPHDDFAVLLNGEVVEALLATTSFQLRKLEIPKGKTAVTFQHRKNPGRFSQSVLDSFSQITNAVGVTRLDDIKFIPNSP